MWDYCRQRDGGKIRAYASYIDRRLLNGQHDGCQSSGFCNGNHSDCAVQWLVEGILQPIYDELSADIQDHDHNMNFDEVLEAVQDAEWLWTLRVRENEYIGAKVNSNNDQRFKVDRNGYVVVYTDGACPGNGQPDAQGGIGVWFGPNHWCNQSMALDSYYRQTNNVAEIRAAIEAIEIVKNFGLQRIAIHTDSEFLYNSMTSYIYSWLESDWTRKNGQPVVNREDFRDLLEAMEDMDVGWVRVNAHEPPGTSRHSLGNNEADYLARAGAGYY